MMASGSQSDIVHPSGRKKSKLIRALTTVFRHKKKSTRVLTQQRLSQDDGQTERRSAESRSSRADSDSHEDSSRSEEDNNHSVSAISTPNTNVEPANQLVDNTGSCDSAASDSEGFYDVEVEQNNVNEIMEATVTDTHEDCGSVVHDGLPAEYPHHTDDCLSVCQRDLLSDIRRTCNSSLDCSDLSSETDRGADHELRRRDTDLSHTQGQVSPSNTRFIVISGLFVVSIGLLSILLQNIFSVPQPPTNTPSIIPDTQANEPSTSFYYGAVVGGVVVLFVCCLFVLAWSVYVERQRDAARREVATRFFASLRPNDSSLVCGVTMMFGVLVLPILVIFQVIYGLNRVLELLSCIIPKASSRRSSTPARQNNISLCPISAHTGKLIIMVMFPFLIPFVLFGQNQNGRSQNGQNQNGRQSSTVRNHNAGTSSDLGLCSLIGKLLKFSASQTSTRGSTVTAPRNTGGSTIGGGTIGGSTAFTLSRMLAPSGGRSNHRSSLNMMRPVHPSVFRARPGRGCNRRCKLCTIM